MTIPFRDLTEEETPGTAGYLKFLPRVNGDIWRGALLVMDARGKQVEFARGEWNGKGSRITRPYAE